MPGTDAVTFPALAVGEYLALFRTVLTSMFDLQQAKIEARVSRQVGLPEDVTRRLTAVFLEAYVQFDLAVQAGREDLALTLRAEPATLATLADSFLALAEFKRALVASGVVGEVEWDRLEVLRSFAQVASRSSGN